uniref:Citramalate synthase n=1 Tax=uncultured bacterium contig00053 TaxID=1181537 RepID=A0A806JY83_9BACT|nr:(R)-citramalate synthase [uncultured bacterium contig00053]
MSKNIEILDTTLRDGAQGEGITFSLRDKITITEALDELGIAWIEAGNPGSNPKDLEFFRLASSFKLKNSKLCAFGSTRKKGVKAAEDSQLQSLLDAGTEGITIFGKSWDLHVSEVLQVLPEENLAMIEETVAFIKAKGRAVIYDAEHFFDGWVSNPSYAISTVKAAIGAGADRIVLCDTNGGNFPDSIAAAVREVINACPNAPIGIHSHNDCGLALANAIAAVQAGCTHVQGTLVGFGERCGNTSLSVLIPSLELKLGLNCLPQGNLVNIGEITRRVAEIANVNINDDMPYIGAHAFSHKAGMHVDGILKNSRSFEHIDPAAVGNERHLLMSEVGGRSAIAERVKKIEPSVNKDHPVIITLAEKLKKLEAQGWAFEGADASFEILIRKELGRYKPLFSIEAYRVFSEHPASEKIACSHAWIKVLVGDQYEIAAAEGVGPVGALDSALRRALTRFFPVLEKVRLDDYKVRVIDGKEATDARVRVLIESTDGQRSWNTVGVSADIIDASRAALVDSVEYMLINGE